MDNQQPKPEIPNEILEEAGSYEQLVRIKGFVWMKSYVEGKLKAFANKALLEGFKSMEEYREEKGKVNGLRDLLGHIENSLQVLEAYRKEKDGKKS